jgi:hypothetical protein
MEYYDSINKSEIHKYFFDKSTKLLQNPKVIAVLENKSIDLNESFEPNLFQTDLYPILLTETEINNRRISFNEKYEYNTADHVLLTEDYSLSQYKSNKTIKRQLTNRDSVALV